VAPRRSQDEPREEGVGDKADVDRGKSTEKVRKEEIVGVTIYCSVYIF